MKSLVARHFAKVLSFLAFLFPILHLVAGTRHQLLHDRIAGIKIIDKNASHGREVSPLQPSTANEDIVCSSLWRRVPAAVLDAIAFNAATTLIICTILLAGAHFFPAPETQDQGIVMALLLTAGTSLLSAVASLVAMAWFEASSLQATPGKIVMGLKVTNTSLGRITLVEALHKQLMQGFLYIAMFPIVGTVFGALLFFSPGLFFKSGLERFISYLWMGPWIFVYLTYGLTICATFFKRRQTLVDLLSHRYVLDESQLNEQDRSRLARGVST